MHRYRPAVWLLVLPMLALLCGCPSATGPRKPGPIRVVTTIAPLAGLVRPLVPPGATVQALIPPNRSEHGYELSARDVAAMADADVVVYVGLGLDSQVESFLKKHPNPNRRDICFASVVGIAQTALAHDEHDEHAHEEGEDHDDDGHHHTGTDPHLWLDPDLCVTLVPVLAQAVGAAGDPAASREAGDTFIAQIHAFDADAKAKLAPFAGRAIVTHHSAWGRLAAHYGLTVAAIIKPIETAEETSGAVDAVIKVIRAQNIQTIFVEPQFSDKAARRIAQETGVRVGRLDPLGDGDWLKMMRANTDALAEALGH